MEAVGSRVVVIGDYQGEGFSQGIDDPARLSALPAGYSGGIWTDRIDLIAPALKSARFSVQSD
jgi:glycerophosphoryl diester phosphodiesterase